MNPLHAQLDDLRGKVGARVRSWTAPSGLPVLDVRGRNDFFVATSAMQKAIRRNLVPEAMTYARALAPRYRNYLPRRLAIIALEDVGYATPNLVATTLLLASDTDLRHGLGNERCLTWLAGELAAAPGDRTACNLAVTAANHPGLRDDLVGLRTHDQLLEVVEEPELGLDEAVRAAEAAQELARRDAFLDVLASAARDVDALTCWTALTAHRLDLEGLAYTFPIARRLVDPASVEIIETDLRTSFVGPWIAPALDLHTRPGTSALRRFLGECGPLAHLLRDVRPTKRVGAARWLVFAAEGALLERKLVFEGSSSLDQWCAEACLADASAPIELLGEGVEIVRRNLPLLQECRLRVLGG